MSMRLGSGGRGTEMVTDKTFINNDPAQLFPDARNEFFMYLQLSICSHIKKTHLAENVSFN